MIPASSRPTTGWLILLVMSVSAINLRSGLVGFSPLLPIVKDQMDLSYTVSGFIMAVPAIFMALSGAVGGYLLMKIGSKQMVGWGVFLTALGNLARGVSVDAVTLLLSSMLFGVGLGLAQAAMPLIVKQSFPNTAGTATGAYTGGMLVGAAMGAALTLPVLLPLSGTLSWRGPMFFWAALAFVALVAWHCAIPAGKSLFQQPDWRSWANVLRKPKAWLVAVLFAAQCSVFYAYISWIPTFYEEAGINSTPIFTVYHLLSIPAAFLIPILSDRLGSRRGLLIATSFMTLAGVLCQTFFYDTIPFVWAGLVGFGITSIFVLCMVLTVDVSEPEEVPGVTALVLFLGYIFSPIAPTFVGWIRDLTGSFTWGLLVPWVLASVLLIVLSWFVPRRVGLSSVPGSSPSGLGGAVSGHHK